PPDSAVRPSPRTVRRPELLRVPRPHRQLTVPLGPGSVPPRPVHLEDPMLYPEPLPARLGRVAAGFSPPLAARHTSLALELPPEQAQRFLSLVVDLDDEA